jgi:hypothetical protein
LRIFGKILLALRFLRLLCKILFGCGMPRWAIASSREEERPGEGGRIATGGGIPHPDPNHSILYPLSIILRFHRCKHAFFSANLAIFEENTPNTPK